MNATQPRTSDGWKPAGKRPKTFSLKSRQSRQKLPFSTNPYYKTVLSGLSIGYRRNASKPTFFGRLYDGTPHSYSETWEADDNKPANGITVLSYDEAVIRILAWHKKRIAENAGEVIVDEAYTVKQAMADYITNLERKKRKPNPRTRSVIDTHILPTLGHLPFKKLTHTKLKEWFDAVADAKPRIRTKDKSIAYRNIDTSDETVLKQRHSTANRILGVLLAALNDAYDDDKVASKDAWQKLKKFKGVDRARLRYLELDEIEKFIPACKYEPFKQLCQADILTGCRYEELTVMLASAFDSKISKVHIPTSKSGKERYIPLNNEGIVFFTRQVEGKKPTALMFTHTDGRQWLSSQQTYHMNAATEAAEIEHAGFHSLRHTFASHLVMQGVPLLVVATLLGHSDTRMVEKHYGHLRQSYVDDTLRANLPSFGFTVRPSDPDDPSPSSIPTNSSEGPKLAIVKGRKKAS